MAPARAGARRPRCSGRPTSGGSGRPNRQSGLEFPAERAATSTCTTSATGSGSRRSSRPDSSHCAASPLSATPSPAWTPRTASAAS
jgi:hypothetical protein